MKLNITNEELYKEDSNNLLKYSVNNDYNQDYFKNKKQDKKIIFDDLSKGININKIQNANIIEVLNNNYKTDDKGKINEDIEKKKFTLENKLGIITKEKENIENKISQIRLIIKKYYEEIKKTEKKIIFLKKENNYYQNENLLLNNEIKMIENVISSIKKNFNQLEEDLSIYI